MRTRITSDDLNEYLGLNLHPTGYDREKAKQLNKYNEIHSEYVYPIASVYDISMLIKILDYNDVISINTMENRDGTYDWEVILRNRDVSFVRVELVYALWKAVRYVIDKEV